MIDFEALARARARALAQPEGEWRQLAQGAALASACETMSDGEILEMFSVATSPGALVSICEAISQAFDSGIESPFEAWKNHFKGLDIGLLEASELWRKAWGSHRRFDECLKAIRRPALVRNARSKSKRGR